MFAARQAGGKLRAAAVLALGALAVHELRYALVLGAHGQTATSAGHGYLHLVAPLLAAAAVAVALISVLSPLVHRRLPRVVADPTSATERAAAYAVVLVVLFV